MPNFHFTALKKCLFSLLFACVFTVLPSSFFPTLANEQADAKENAVPENAVPENGAINASTTRKLMDKYGSDLLIIDVRTEKEFKQGHLPEAVLIPIDVFSRSLGKIPMDKPILLLCRSGGRAGGAFKILKGARPVQKNMWFFKGYPQYGEDNYYELNDRERLYR